MNKEVIKGIERTIEGLNLLCKALNDSIEKPSNQSDSITSKAVEDEKAIGKTIAKTTPAKTSSGERKYTTAELSGMKYNEFKKLAASLGVDCKGSRNEIMSRVTALGVVVDADDSNVPEDITSAKSNKSANVGKNGIKKANTSTVDEFDEQAEEIAKETSFKEIVSALKDVGVTATKFNYKKQLAKALREGLLDVGDEDEDEDEEVSEEGESGITPDTYTADYDLSEVNDPDTMSETRAKACVEKQGAILDSISSGELDSDTIVDFLQNNASQEELDLLGDDYTEEDLVRLYLEVTKHFIDDDGDEHEPGEAYMIGDMALCCGRPLAYDDKTGKFLCSHCASEYEAE